ncbi:MAG: WYL domain-containing protein [Mesorhizobium sp.]|nr:MAG: WYL domain-containing protein [Mesorhizobium sp.]
MSRSERLLDLVQILRRHRRPVSGRTLADEMGVSIDLGVVRQAIREERKLGFLYRDAEGAASERLVWPFALAFFDKVRVMAAWCETRQDFRHFRADRMSDLTATGIRYPRRRQAMLKEWRATLDAPRSNARRDDSA